MKIFLFLTFIFLFSSVVFAQTIQEKIVHLSSKAIKKRVIKQEFSDIPQSVLDCQATGTFSLYIQVNQEGRVVKATLYAGLCPKADLYVEKTVATWKFKPLQVNKRRVSFIGHIAIPFHYGRFNEVYFRGSGRKF
jgi:hypothetical protein